MSAATPARNGRSFWARLFHRRNAGEELRDTLEELLEQDDPNEDSPVAADERQLIGNILNLRDLTAHDVMVPYADISAVNADTNLVDLIRTMGETAHSRMPVHRETLDDVFGMVHIKDVLACMHADTPFKLSDIVRPLLFVAPTMPIMELLLQMRVDRIHMALVIDEFGGVDGLITIEDLVEEIVGEIEDEHDQETEPDIQRRPDGSIEADARVRVDTFENFTGALLSNDERQEDIDTLGGLVFFLAGRVPQRGELVPHGSGTEFEILDAEPRRIRRLRILTPPTSDKVATGCQDDHSPEAGT